jgi:ribonucleoside-diphosphate reductase subunit M2
VEWKSRLNSDERHFIETVRAFFAASDGIVMDNISVNFQKEVQIPEARQFYAFQNAMESIHSETYSVIIDSLVKEKERLFNAMHENATIKRKAEWAQKYMSQTVPFATRLFAFACVEGIFFSGSFCAIFWLKKRGLMPGLTFSNELISRDEGLHRDFAILIQSKLENPISEEEAREIVQSAIEIEKDFVCDALSVGLIGINAGLMSEYIEYVADHLMASSGFGKVFNSNNPFDWMEIISLQGKTNFFEKRVGEYAKAGVMDSLENKGSAHTIAFDEDF